MNSLAPRRRTLAAFFAAAALLASCGSPFGGGPRRPRVDGYRARALIEEGTLRTEFEIAVRGTDRRVERPDAAPWTVLVVKGAERRAFELDPKGKRWRAVDFASRADVLPGHPLDPGFSDREEGKRRRLDTYSRESDAVFAGNACQLWRFEDSPDDPASPSTTYWVVPVLDSLVVRKDDERPRPGGTREKRSTELRNVRPGAEPGLFERPAGFSEDRP